MQRERVLFYIAGALTTLTYGLHTMPRRCARFDRSIKLSGKISRLLFDFVTHFAAQVDLYQVEEAAGHEVCRVDQVRQQLQRKRVLYIECPSVGLIECLLRALVTAKADSVNRAT